MVTIDQIEQGVAKFIDNDFIPSMNRSEATGFVMSLAAGLLLRQFHTIAEKVMQQPIVKMTGLVSENGEVDIDAIREEMVKAMPEKGTSFPIEFKALHKTFDITLTPGDVDKIYGYITE